jgi:hypothetical protein
MPIFSTLSNLGNSILPLSSNIKFSSFPELEEKGDRRRGEEKRRK